MNKKEEIRNLTNNIFSKYATDENETVDCESIENNLKDFFQIILNWAQKEE